MDPDAPKQYKKSTVRVGRAGTSNAAPTLPVKPAKPPAPHRPANPPQRRSTAGAGRGQIGGTAAAVFAAQQQRQQAEKLRQQQLYAQQRQAAAAAAAGLTPQQYALLQQQKYLQQQQQQQQQQQLAYQKQQLAYRQQQQYLAQQKARQQFQQTQQQRATPVVNSSGEFCGTSETSSPLPLPPKPTDKPLPIPPKPTTAPLPIPAKPTEQEIPQELPEEPVDFNQEPENLSEPPKNLNPQERLAEIMTRKSQPSASPISEETEKPNHRMLPVPPKSSETLNSSPREEQEKPQVPSLPVPSKPSRVLSPRSKPTSKPLTRPTLAKKPGKPATKPTLASRDQRPSETTQGSRTGESPRAMSEALAQPLPVPPKPEALAQPLPVPPKPEALAQPLPVPPKPTLKPSLPAKPPTKPSLPPKKPPQLPSKPALPAKEKVEELQWPADKTPFEKPDDPSVIVFDSPDESNPFAKPKIKAATIEKLVEKATHPKAVPAMQKTFLLTYRSIITPMELLELLKLRYSMPLPEGNEASLKLFQATHQKPIQLRVCQLLKSWVQRHYTDFENDEALRDAFMDFATNTIKPSYPVGATLESIMTRQINGEFAKAKDAVFTNDPPKSIVPKSTSFSLLDLSPLEVARQLTLIETNIFRNIAPSECNGLAWSKKDAKDRAPNILTMINRFNQVSDWVVTEIVKTENAKQRTEVLSKFIEIAARCKSLNNFNGAMEIISGLGNSAIHRLKPNWAELSKKVTAAYNELTEILSSDGSYKAFRGFLKTVDGPCIPYLGMYLTDLTFIEDGNPSKINELHNFAKRIFVSNVIQEIQQYQQTPYHLQEVHSIINYLQGVFDNNIDNEEAYQLSLQILPRGGAKPSSTVPPSPSTPHKGSSNQNNKSSTTETTSKEKEKTDDFGLMEEIEGYLFNTPDSPENIQITEKSDPHEPPIINAGTLQKLVERVTFRDYPDPRFLDVFLLTYREFTNGADLMNLLIMRFNMPLPKNTEHLDRFRSQVQLPIQMRVLNLLKTWTDKHPGDFLVEKSLREIFFKFCTENNSIHAVKLKRMMKSLKRTLVSIRSGDKNQSRVQQIMTESIPKPFAISSSADVKHLKIYDFHHEEIARQLSLVDFQLFFTIQDRELLNYDKEENQSRACPTLTKMLRNSQTLGDWVLYETFCKTTGDEEHDTEVFMEKLIFFVNVADSCFRLGNFHSFFSIFQSICSSEVREYGQLWELLRNSTKGKLEELEIHLSNMDSLDSFRSSISKIGERFSSAGVPPVQIFLKELRKVEEEEENYLSGDHSSGIINMSKHTHKAVIINQFSSYKNIPFSFESVEWLMNYILSDIPRLASFRSGISFVDQFKTLDPQKIKSSIQSQILEDPEVRAQLSNLLRDSLKEQLDQESKLEGLYKQLEDFKQGMRNELQSIYDALDQQDAIQQKVTSMVQEKFPNSVLEEWSSEDQEGFVYGWPESITINTLQQDGDTHMVFSKSYLDRSELSLLLKMKGFYEQYSGTKDVRVLAYACYIDSDVREVAQQNDVELIPLPRSA